MLIDVHADNARQKLDFLDNAIVIVVEHAQPLNDELSELSE